MYFYKKHMQNNELLHSAHRTLKAINQAPKDWLNIIDHKDILAEKNFKQVQILLQKIELDWKIHPQQKIDLLEKITHLCEMTKNDSKFEAHHEHANTVSAFVMEIHWRISMVRFANDEDSIVIEWERSMKKIDSLIDSHHNSLIEQFQRNIDRNNWSLENPLSELDNFLKYNDEKLQEINQILNQWWRIETFSFNQNQKFLDQSIITLTEIRKSLNDWKHFEDFCYIGSIIQWMQDAKFNLIKTQEAA